jgi:hypothetical protein
MLTPSWTGPRTSRSKGRPEPEPVFSLSFPEVAPAETGSRPLSLADLGFATGLSATSVPPRAAAPTYEDEPVPDEVRDRARGPWLRRLAVVSAAVLGFAIAAQPEAGEALIRQARAELPGRAAASVELVGDYVHTLRTWCR